MTQSPQRIEPPPNPERFNVSHVLDACGFPPRMIRCTRLLDLVNTMDPKVVAAAFGRDPEATMIYLSDRVDETRLSGWETTKD